MCILYAGGGVGKNPTKEFLFGVETVEMAPAWKSLPWMSSIAKDVAPEASDPIRTSYNVYESHGDCITDLPSVVELLGSSSRCRNEVYVYKDKLLAFQSHPEFTPEIVSSGYFKLSTFRGLP